MIAVILAAGQGTRMHSDQAKVLHRMAGMPLIEHVVRTAIEAGVERQIVVIGHGRDAVRDALRRYPVEFAVQEEQLGTGHAAMMAEPLLRGVRGDLLVLCGDVPLIRPETIRSLEETHAREGNAATVLTARFEDAAGYGRIVKGARGELLRIVEHRDASAEEREIREINSGTYCFSIPELFEALRELTPENSQRELYLTDAIALLRARGLRVGAWCVEDAEEVSGVNTPQDLAHAEAVYLGRRCAFCRAAAGGEAASRVLRRGRHALLALAEEPYNSGHCLVIPYRHAATLEALGAEAAAEILELAALAEDAMARAYRPEGYNMGANTGAVDGAGMSDHFVWHVIPRWCGDTNFMASIGGTKVLPESIERTFERLRDALAASED